MEKRDFLQELINRGWTPEELAELLRELKVEMEQYHLPKTMTREQRVDEVLKEVGIPSNVIGRIYLREAICILLQRSKMQMNELETIIARKYKTSKSSVDRCFRTAIERCFYISPNPKLSEVLGSIIYDQGKATNSQFIWAVVLYLNS